MPATNTIQSSYAAQILDKEALKDSTSGGLFTAFSREIFRRGGVVYGCVWDKDYNAVVRKAENEEEMKPMRGSKYVWSCAADTFPEIKALLEVGRTVMFTGLPCQVAGLKNYLRKDYPNLYLVDFFCGGSPSPFAFHEYLKTITKRVTLEKLDFKLRDKSKYGVGVHISYEGPKGRIHQSYVRNPYFYSYHTKVFHRKPCYQCQYRYDRRVEDLTIGDYWGIRNYHHEFEIRAGVSILLVNNEKAQAFVDSVKSQLQLVPTKVEDIARHNALTLDGSKRIYNPPEFRDAFFQTIREQGWTKAERKYLYSRNRLKLWVKLTIPYRILVRIKKKLLK